MKKQRVLSTIFITIGVVIVLAISAFGVASLLAPVAMMNFTASIGLKSISADYAYQEYERSGDVACLARSFVISAGLKHDRTANDRFNILYSLEGFDEFCAEQDETIEKVEGTEGYSYRSYVCGLAACVRYRLAKTDEEKLAVLTFASEQTETSFPQGNPLIQLTAEAAGASDSAFCTLVLEEMQSGKYDTESKDYENIIKILESVTNVAE